MISTTTEEDDDLIPSYVRGSIQGSVLSAAVECGIFEELGRESQTVSSLAERLHLDPGVLEIVVETLVAMRLLQYSPSTPKIFSLTPTSRKHLLGASPTGQLGFLRAILVPYTQWTLLTIEEQLRTGRCPPDTYHTKDVILRDGTPHFAKTSVDLSQALGKQLVEVVQALPAASRDSFQFADAPCGSGAYGAEVAARFPSSSFSFSFFDLDDVIPHTKENHRRYYPDLAPRFEYFPGNMLTRPTDDIENRYDMILVSFSYHQWESDQALEFTQLYYKMARSNGTLIVHELIRSDPIPSKGAATFPWYIRAGMIEHFRSWTVETLTHLLQGVGWRDVSIVDRTPWGSMFVTAVKP